MISRANCISEHVLNGTTCPQGNLCYLGGTLKEERKANTQVRRKQVKGLFSHCDLCPICDKQGPGYFKFKLDNFCQSITEGIPTWVK